MPFSLPGDCKGREPSLDTLISLRSGEGVGALFPFAVDCCGFGFAGLGFFYQAYFLLISLNGVLLILLFVEEAM